jgi:ABC-type multidrug transport system fused ATPase/permease subunit
VLYVTIRIGNMALLDFASYVFAAVLMLLFVRIPSLVRTAQETRGKGSLWQEMRFGWDYITARKGLLALLVFFMIFNFLFGVIGPLLVPLILDTWDASTLGYLSTLMGVGMLAGTLVISAWGGGKRKIFTLLGFDLLSGLFLVAVCLRVSIPLLAVCGFGAMFCGPFSNASSQAIWQAKVAPELQGRVFAIRRTIAMSASILAPLLAAPLADYVFKPAMAPGGALALVLGPIIGMGAGRGVGVLISVVGLIIMATTLGAICVPQLRRVELDLPDHDPASVVV